MTAEKMAEQIVDAFQQEENYLLERLEALALERVIDDHLQPLYAVVEAARAFAAKDSAANYRTLQAALAALQTKEAKGE